MWKYAIAILILPLSGYATVPTVTPKDTLTQTTPVPPPPPGTHLTCYMMISPTSRAADFQQAFEQLKKEKSAGKVYFQFADGSTITNVIDMNAMANSTLILFRYNSSQGIRFQAVKVEDIVNIYY